MQPALVRSAVRRGQRPLAGLLRMPLTGATGAAVMALAKPDGTGLPAHQVAFLRHVLGVVFLVPIPGPLRRAGLDRRALAVCGGRGRAHAVGVICWFHAMTRLPIAEVIAMNSLTPVLVTIGAAFVFGDRPAGRRIVALAVAFAGVLVILRPGVREVSDGHVAMLFTALVFGAAYVMARTPSARDPAAVVVAMLQVSVTIPRAPFALSVR